MTTGWYKVHIGSNNINALASLHKLMKFGDMRIRTIEQMPDKPIYGGSTVWQVTLSERQEHEA